MLPILLPFVAFTGLLLTNCSRQTSQTKDSQPSPQGQDNDREGAVLAKAEAKLAHTVIRTLKDVPKPSVPKHSIAFKDVSRESAAEVNNAWQYGKPKEIFFSQYVRPHPLLRKPFPGNWDLQTCDSETQIVDLSDSGALKVSLVPVLTLENSCKTYIFSAGMEKFDSQHLLGSFSNEISILLGNGARPVELLKGDFNEDKIQDIAIAFDDNRGILFPGKGYDGPPIKGRKPAATW